MKPRVASHRAVVLAAFVVLGACTEATAPPRRFAILDDVGQSNWTAVTVGGDHSCGLKATGDAYCWGSNASGQLGTAHSDTTCGTGDASFGCSVRPARVDFSTTWMSLSAGAHHTCGITTSRTAYCWGANDQAQTSNLSVGGPTPVLVPGALGWTQISAGYSHTCAVRTDGALFCWGANDRGQLGNGTTTSTGDMIRVRMQAAVASVSTGQARTCARTVTGVVYCWGAVWVDTEDGLEYTRAQLTPERVPGSPALSSVSVGSFTTCGADLNGVGFCWEANPRGEMGTGTRIGNTTPQAVAGGLVFVQLSAGIVQTCGVTANGAGYCWGDDSFGELGVLPTLLLEQCGGAQLYCSTVPVPVYGRQHFTEISTGFGSHTCGVTTRGNLYCWGLGVSGQRGDGTAASAITTPTKVIEP